MPEGPSIVILKELVQGFTGLEVIAADGNTKVPLDRVPGQRVVAFKSWGKHFLVCFENFTLKVHLLLFGSYRVNEQRLATPRLSLVFETGEINFYACKVEFLEGNLDDHYDWQADVMNDSWNERKARAKLKLLPARLVCDALLDQDIFAGVGNIIKNEVLFRVKVHPESQVGAMPPRHLGRLLKEARNYSFDFLEWKKHFVLREHWLAHTKKICPRCNIPLVKKHTGKSNRRSFFCINCQVLYNLKLVPKGEHPD